MQDIDNVHFVFKPNKILAPRLDLQAQVVISSDSKSKAVTFVPDKGAVDAVLLHHMINCGRIYSRGPNKEHSQTLSSHTYHCAGRKIEMS